MKKIIKLIKDFPYIFICLVAIIIFFPTSLASPPESDKKAIITALGIDLLQENQVELSAVMLTPLENATFSQNDTFVSMKGDTIGESLAKLSLKVGKTIALAHTEIIVIGKKLAEENLIDIMDHIARNRDISNNILIIVTSGDAKKLVEESNKLSSQTGFSVADLLYNNERFVTGTSTTLESFYKGNFSPSKSTILAVVDLDENAQTSKASQSTSDSSNTNSQHSSSGGESNLDMFQNEGRACLIKNGKAVRYLTETNARGINWINDLSRVGSLELTNVNTDKIDNAIVSLEVKAKKVNKRTYFENGKPVIKFGITLGVEIEEIYEINSSSNLLSQNTQFFDEQIQVKIAETIKQEFSDVLQILKEEKTDIFSIYDLFYKNNKNEFKKYLNSLEDKENYLDGISFRIVVDSKEYK